MRAAPDPGRSSLGRALIVGLLGLGAGLVLCLLVLAGWAGVARVLTPRTTHEVCSPAVAAEGSGWCVRQQVGVPSSPFGAGREQLSIWRVENGEAIPRYTAGPYPLASDTFEAEFGPDSITVTDPVTGIMIIYPESYYALG